MKLNHEYLDSEVARLFSLLDVSIQNKIRENWSRLGENGFSLVTKSEHFEAFIGSLGWNVDIAGTNGMTIAINIPRLIESGGDYRLVILHELAHCYLIAAGRSTLAKYREDEKHRIKNERETIKLSNMWFKRISHHDNMRGS